MSKLNGQVKFTARDGKEYTLWLSMNAWADFEAQTGKNAFTVFDTKPNDPPPLSSDLRALFWAALQDHHEGMTLREAGRIFDQTALMSAMAAATPDADKSGNDQAAA